MPGVTKRTFSLPEEQSAYIDAKVEEGAYASSSEVIREGLRALQRQEQAIERWLEEEVAKTHDAVKSGEQKTSPLGDVFDEIRSKHKGK